MIVEQFKIICDGLAVLFAFMAGILWVFASRHPVGTNNYTFYADSGRLAKAIKDTNNKIIRGVWFNKWAAIVTGLAAFAACASWTIQFFIASNLH